MEQTEQVEVTLLKYAFRFKRLLWRDDAIIEYGKRDPQRVILAHALLEISGLRPQNIDEAISVMNAIPAAIVDRVFRIWRGSFPPAKKYTTSNLYMAPEPQKIIQKLDEEESSEEVEHNRFMQSLEAKYGLQEVQEAKELTQTILKKAQKPGGGGYRGAVVATEDSNGY